MSLVVSGLSHHTSDVELREKFVFSEDAIPDALRQLRKRLTDAGVVIVSTCNRSEVYLNHAAPADDLHHEIRRFFSVWHDVPEAEFEEHVYQYYGRGAVGHLFKMVSSLDSMVLGETQILGQVHDAYLLAHGEQATDKVINTLFQKAFTVAKRVRTQTRVTSGKVSVSSVAVDLAVSIFTDLTGKTVMVVGSGEMAELTLKNLVGRGVGKVLVANRTLERAEELAALYNGKAVPLDDLDFHLHRADIVVSSTAAPGIVLRSGHFQKALRQRAHEPMFVIDIAVPRDIEASVNDLDNVYLYNIDDLQEVAEQNIAARRAEVDKCLEMIDAGVEQFWKWHQSLIAQPIIVSLSREFHSIRQRELDKTLSALPALSKKDREEVVYLSKRIVNNILQQPVVQLKAEVREQDPGNVLQLVRRLFGLKEST